MSLLSRGHLQFDGKCQDSAPDYLGHPTMRDPPASMATRSRSYDMYKYKIPGNYLKPDKETIQNLNEN